MHLTDINYNKEGIINEIERYSINDGPGIRTNIFFKGCPLKCEWCSNPETQDINTVLMYWNTRCLACGACIKACPHSALTFKDGIININRKLCTGCGTCCSVCNSEALTISGKKFSVKNILKIILKDSPFYERSNGGVTFSGGEATLQFDFLLELSKACKKEHINTAIETCGLAPWENMKELKKYIDIFLFDLKIIDSDSHKRYTGQSNSQILDNFARLASCNTEIIARIPIIPGINNSRENIADTIEFLQKTKPGCKVSLLPYHRLGVNKYQKLDKKYSLTDTPVPTEEEMSLLAKYFQKKGFDITINE